MDVTTKRETVNVFDTVDEKKFVYSTTCNPQLDELDEILEKNEDLLNYTFVHKLNSKLKLLYTFRKMQFGAQILLIFAPLLYASWALYMMIKPLDTMEAVDENNNMEIIHFNTGAIVFANFLQLLICIVFIVHGVIGIIIIKRDPESAVRVFDRLIFTNILPVLILFYIYSFIRFCVYTAGMENWIEAKSAQITKTQKFYISDERDVVIGPNESGPAIAWINFKFIVPGIIFPCVVFYVIFFVVFLALAVINNIHRIKIVDRDSYIKTLYCSKKVQDYIEALKNAASSEGEMNDRDEKFDINSELSEAVKRFERNIQKEAIRDSQLLATELGQRESIQPFSPLNRDSVFVLFGNRNREKVAPIDTYVQEDSKQDWPSKFDS